MIEMAEQKQIVKQRLYKIFKEEKRQGEEPGIGKTRRLKKLTIQSLDSPERAAEEAEERQQQVMQS